MPSPRQPAGLAGALPQWQRQRLDTYIDANLDAPLRSCSLAAQLGLSVSHFNRAFKAATGMPPRLYILQRRVEAACAAMRSSDTPLTGIAYACGFYDQSHFSRSFVKCMGTAPLAWRRSQPPL